jgi:hypothetical protein
VDGVALQKKTIGRLNFKMKFSVKSNIERHLLKAEKVYKIETHQQVDSRGEGSFQKP